MALQGSGAISFSQLQTEFGGANPIGFSEYYLGGDKVHGASTNPNGIPSSGQLDISDFYGSAQYTPPAQQWNYHDASGVGARSSHTQGLTTIYQTGLSTDIPGHPNVTGSLVFNTSTRDVIGAVMSSPYGNADLASKLSQYGAWRIQAGDGGATGFGGPSYRDVFNAINTTLTNGSLSDVSGVYMLTSGVLPTWNNLANGKLELWIHVRGYF